ncbi:2-dehydropantoate 2-reductase [Defluviimonas aestuarii]|uniref:2-dehydropantoate 2-reductase n=1 Tax=Albidovulum aestuarii TaxID=1130726 RepID=UPI00249BD521|nr:2-dehydropantoate 2-reductase [Defluviimonas aestuarii]MDI3336875.1 2-dehydropantoate 2-reductase [Defluviimonas aestuarii]
MKIAVMGAGALGGYFGGRLAAAGHEVTLIARGAHLAAIQRNGLRILSPKGDLHLQGIGATDDPATVGPVDVILFMVKNYDLEHASQAIRPMLGRDTLVVTCQNGVSAPDRLAAAIGAARVVPGVVRMPADIREPGVVRHSAEAEMFTFGELDGRTSDRVTGLRDALVAAGVNAVIPDSIQHDLWAKFIVQASLASITTLTRLDIGPLREHPATKQLFLDSIQEAEQVGRAVVPDLPAGLVENSWAFLNKFPPTMHASMLDDLRRGKPLEIDYLGGDVVRLGAELGVATPIHAVFYSALLPFRDGAPAGAKGAGQMDKT